MGFFSDLFAPTGKSEAKRKHKPLFSEDDMLFLMMMEEEEMEEEDEG